MNRRGFLGALVAGAALAIGSRLAPAGYPELVPVPRLFTDNFEGGGDLLTHWFADAQDAYATGVLAGGTIEFYSGRIPSGGAPDPANLIATMRFPRE